jgi:hypothetical protein
LKRIGEVNIKNKLEMFKCFAPPWGQNLYPRDNENTILVEAFLLYITMHSLFSPHVRL